MALHAAGVFDGFMLTFLSSPSFLLRVLFLSSLLFFLILGGLLRVEDTTSRTFWGDEAWRTQQILHAESYHTLLRGEYFGMEMPVQYGEYLLGKAGLIIFGKSEWAFRIWSILASLLTLGVATALGWRAHQRGELSRFGCSLFVLLCALSSGFVEHTHEFKPYAVESALFLLLTYFFTAERLEGRSVLLLGMFFTLASFFGSVWLFAGCIPLFLLPRALSLPWRQRLMLLLFAVLSLTGIALFLFYKNMVTARGVTDFWSPYTLDSFEKIHHALFQIFPSTLQWYLFDPLVHLGLPISLLALFAAISVFGFSTSLLFREGRFRRMGIMILFPLGVMILLGLLGEYPFFMRVSSFYYPLFLFGAISGGDGAVRFLTRKYLSPQSRNVLHGTALFAVLLTPIFLPIWDGAPERGQLVRNHGSHRRDQNIKGYLEVISEAASPHAVFLNYQAKLALAFYTPEPLFAGEYEELHTPKNPQRRKTCREVRSEYAVLQEAWLLAIDRVANYELLKSCCQRSPSCEVFFEDKQPKAFLLGFRYSEDPPNTN
ncbi:hypothetical protein MRY87_02035 [bacterium]|nr:hypothetical protein [bacterium]